MTDSYPERDPRVVRRELRIERALVGAVLHGYRGDNEGFNSAITDVWMTESATPAEINNILFWALSRLPRGIADPTTLQDRLATLYGVPDGD